MNRPTLSGYTAVIAAHIAGDGFARACQSGAYLLMTSVDGSSLLDLIQTMTLIVLVKNKGSQLLF